MKNYKIAASLLSADFAILGQEVAQVIQAGADWIHFDVMDNHYVPNLTFGPMVCQALRPYAQTEEGRTVPIDVHLMAAPVDALVTSFAQAGADLISFHPEASAHIDRTLQLICQNGCKAGLVFNPATPLDVLPWVMDRLDFVLIMSVNPGFGGQVFIDGMLRKIELARKQIDAYCCASGREIDLQVDGGIKPENIRQVTSAGANVFVAGSAIFGENDYALAIQKMKNGISAAVNPKS